MSMIALLKAVKVKLKANATLLALTPSGQGIEIVPPNGQPPPYQGIFWIGVHEAQVRSAESWSDLDQYFNIDVTITKRVVGTPWDRLTQMDLYGDSNAVPSLDYITRLVANLLHTDTADNNIINQANTYLSSPGNSVPAEGFYEPLRMLSIDVARAVGPDWFHADVTDADAAVQNIGWAKTVHAGGARRTQETLFSN